jgi:hypothetical protein
MVQVTADVAAVPAGGGVSTALTLAVARSAPFDAGATALDLHEGISDPPSGCERWPAHFRLLSDLGEVVMGRCRATNLCPYCRVLAVVETAEMLWLDAAEWPPTLWVVLTAREHLTRPETYRHLEQLRRASRRRWPSIEWFVQVEFQRRGALHLNLLVKGVDVADADQLLALLSERWCARVDALPVGQHIEQLSSAQAVTRYLQKELTHGLKREQAPPIGWRGHRTSQTRGYLVRPASVMREEARRSLRSKRELWHARRAGLEGQAAEDAANAALDQADQTTWRLWQLPKTGSGHVGQRPAAKDGPRKRYRHVVVGEALRLEYRRLLSDLEAGQSNPPSEQLPLLAEGP